MEDPIAFPIQGDGRAKLLKVNRVEVIDSTGRAYVEMAATDVHLALQDGGYTLKVLLANRPSDRYDPLRNRWGVRTPDGAMYVGLSQGDAENLEAIAGGQLVAWVNDGWEDVPDV